MSIIEFLWNKLVRLGLLKEIGLPGSKDYTISDIESVFKFGLAIGIIIGALIVGVVQFIYVVLS